MNNRLILTDSLWEKIAPLVPGKAGDRGTSGVDNRLFVEAVLHVARTGIPWRDTPESFGAWNTIYKRFSRWGEKRVWEKIFAECSANGDLSEVSMDGTIVRAHQHAAGAKKKREIRLLAVLVEALQRKFTL
jgi:transposase